MENSPYIILFPTTRCDVGCQHCMNNAITDGLDMPLDYLKLLIRKLQNENLQATFCATGFGEPLLYPHFEKLTDLILGKYAAKELTLVTAGYTTGESGKRNNLLQLLQKEYSEKVALIMSYNLYGNFDKRIFAFLKDLNEFKKEVLVNVKMCVSMENAEQTVEKFLRLLIRFARDNTLPEVGDCGVDENFNWKNGPTIVESKKYLLHGKHTDHKIRTMFHTLSLIGKATNLGETPYYRQKCNCLDENAETELVLFPDGYFYPCERSIGNKNRALGHITTHSINYMMKKKRRLTRFAKKVFTPFEIIFEKTPCKICRKLPI